MGYVPSITNKILGIINNITNSGCKPNFILLQQNYNRIQDIMYISDAPYKYKVQAHDDQTEAELIR